MKILINLSLLLSVIGAACGQQTTYKKEEMANQDWKQKLTPEQYRVMREKGTERAWTGAYVDHHEDGIYTCAACGTPLFDSQTKFESGSGWPSFFDIRDSANVKLEEDRSLGMKRIEVMCNNCGGHLGHVFDDGPMPTGLRYCINSISLDFEGRER
jgi:peptide-methionine (R)-S-oxide reductase